MRSFMGKCFVYCIASGKSPMLSSISNGGVTAMESSELPPCQPPWAFNMTFLPVKPRASRTAYIVASVPEQQKRTCSAHGTSSHTSSANSTWCLFTTPQCVPLRAPRLTAFMISGGLWPRIRPEWPTQ